MREVLYEQFRAAYGSPEADPAHVMEATWQWIGFVALAVLEQVGGPTDGDTALRLVFRARELAGERLDRFDMRRRPMDPDIELENLYRATWWLQRSWKLEPAGTLANGAPYRDLRHLANAVDNSTLQLLAALTPASDTTDAPAYWWLLPGQVMPVALRGADDWRFAESVWAAAHEPGPVTAWDPVVFDLQPPTPTLRRGFFDVLEGNESHLYSTRFREAVDDCRSDDDRYQWLPATVVDGESGDRRDYWLLSVEGMDACLFGSVVAERAAGRSVVLCGVGDNPAAFADAVRSAVAAVCENIDAQQI